MITILRSPFCRTRGPQSLETSSGWIADIHPPKLIVGLSLTLDTELSFPRGVRAFPAILDTGLNRTLEIDERHLTEWSDYDESWLVAIEGGQTLKDKESSVSDYYVSNAHIWLHRTPYENPSKLATKSPVLLKRSLQVRVMAPKTAHPWPPLPLLGLEALTANDLQLCINSKRCEFTISCSLTSFVLDFMF